MFHKAKVAAFSEIRTKHTNAAYAARFLDFYYRPGLMHVGRISTS
jgi:hypothetical protein